MQDVLRKECERDIDLKKRYMDVKRRVFASDAARVSPKMKEVERVHMQNSEIRLQNMIERDQMIMDQKVDHLDHELERQMGVNNSLTKTG